MQSEQAVKSMNGSQVNGIPIFGYSHFEKCLRDSNATLPNEENVTPTLDNSQGTYPRNHISKRFCQRNAACAGPLGFSKLNDSIGKNGGECSVENEGVRTENVNRNIVVTNMHPSLDDDYLFDIFNRFGEIVHCRVFDKNRRCCSGFIKFAHPDAARTAIAVMQNEPIMGRRLTVRYWQDKGKKFFATSPQMMGYHHQPPNQNQNSQNLLFNSDKCWSDRRNSRFHNEQYNIHSPSVSTALLHPNAFPNPNYYGYMYDPSQMSPVGPNRRSNPNSSDDPHNCYQNIPFNVPTLDLSSGLYDYVPKSKSSRLKKNCPHEVDLGPKYDDSESESEDQTTTAEAGGSAVAPKSKEMPKLDEEELENYPTFLQAYQSGVFKEDGSVILTPEMVDRAKNNRAERTQMFGERLFPLVQGMVTNKRMTGAVTCEIMERSDAELMKLLHDMNPLQIVVKTIEARLTASDLRKYGRTDRNQFFGDKLFPLVQNLTACKGNTGSVTGTLLESNDAELLHYLENYDDLKLEVEKMEKSNLAPQV